MSYYAVRAAWRKIKARGVRADVAIPVEAAVRSVTQVVGKLYGPSCGQLRRRGSL